MSSVKYQDTFAKSIPYVKSLYTSSWNLKQDGAALHTSMRAREFVSEHHVQVSLSFLIWGLENVWEILKCNVEKGKPKNLDDLRRYMGISRATNKTDKEDFD